VLEGKLGDFSLPDIFQLIALTRKSGALLVTSTDAQGRILFNDGEVCYAVADVKRVAIGARLVQAGLATEEQVLQVLETKRAEGFQGSLAQALLQSVEVDEAELDLFMRSQIEDAVFDLLRLTEASFAFDASVEPDTSVGMTVSTEHLIVEGGRRLAEWSAIREHIPGSEVVLVLSPNAGATDGRVSITAAQWHVLTLVDGRRTVADIVDLAGHGEFQTSRLLAAMAAQGLVEVFQTPEGQTGAFSDMLGRRYRLRRIEELELGQPSRTGSRTDRSAGAAAAGPREPLIPQQPRGPSAVRAHAPAAPSPLAAVRALQPAMASSAPAGPAAEPAAGASLLTEMGEDAAGNDQEAVHTETAANGPTHRDEKVADAAADDSPSSDGDARTDAPSAAADAASADGASGSGSSTTSSQTGPPGARPPTAVDRAQVARELASLGLGGEDGPVARPTVPSESSPAASTAQPAAAAENGSGSTEGHQKLIRDEDVNKGLLLRLIDGVKGA
jgi:hypothetical protein